MHGKKAKSMDIWKMKKITLKTALVYALNEWSNCNPFWYRFLYDDRVEFKPTETHCEINFENSPVVIMQFTQQQSFWKPIFTIKDGEKYYAFVYDKNNKVEKILAHKEAIIEETTFQGEKLCDWAKEIFRNDILNFRVCKRIVLPIVPSENTQCISNVKIYDGEDIERCIMNLLLVYFIGAKSGKVWAIFVK